MTKRAQILSDAMDRLSAWRDGAVRRIMAEAERAVGIPYHGCVWHNADLSYGTPTQWREWGAAQHKAVKRMAWQSGRVSAEYRRLSDALYAKYVNAVREGR